MSNKTRQSNKKTQVVASRIIDRYERALHEEKKAASSYIHKLKQQHEKDHKFLDDSWNAKYQHLVFQMKVGAAVAGVIILSLTACVIFM